MVLSGGSARSRAPNWGGRGCNQPPLNFAEFGAPASDGSVRWFCCHVVPSSGSVMWFRQWFRQVVPSGGSVRWLRQVVPSGGSVRWFRQAVLSGGYVRWFRHVVPSGGSVKRFCQAVPSGGILSYLINSTIIMLFYLLLLRLVTFQCILNISLLVSLHLYDSM